MRKRAADGLLAACGGETIVEFALVGPMFLMLVFGCLEYGRLLWTEMALQQTAMAGARCMAIAQATVQNSSSCTSGSPATYSSSSTTSYIESVASGWGLTLTNSEVSLNNAATCGGVSPSSQVMLTTTFTTPVPQLVLLAAGGTSLTATACYPNNAY
jgi:Flp pilus assembly protein TadG